MQDDIEETNFLEKIKPKSWYVSNKEFDEIEISYINFLQGMFNVPDNEGNPIPYIMTDYQKEFHSESLNIKRENAKDILFIKARGVSFTTSSCIELIVSALTFKNQVFPIIAQRQDMGKHILDICKWLIRNSNFKTEVDIQESQIKFLSTGSIIKYFPSGSASDSTRGLRLIRCLPGDVKITTNMGEIPIKEIVENKLKLKVLTYNEDKKRLEWKKIKNYFKTPLGNREIVKINNKLRCTNDHPVFTNKGYIESDMLNKGQRIYKLKTYSYLYEPYKTKSPNETERGGRTNNSWEHIGGWRGNKKEKKKRIFLLHRINKEKRVFVMEEEKIRSIRTENIHPKNRLQFRSNPTCNESPSLFYRTFSPYKEVWEENDNERVYEPFEAIRSGGMVHGRWQSGEAKQICFIINSLFFIDGTRDIQRMVSREIWNNPFHQRGQEGQGILPNFFGNEPGEIIQDNLSFHTSGYGIQDMEESMQAMWERIFSDREQSILFEGMQRNIPKGDKKKSIRKTKKKTPRGDDLLCVQEKIYDYENQRKEKESNLRFKGVHENKGKRNRQNTIPKKRLLPYLHKTIQDEETFVYDLEIEGNHNFFANEILVHNCLVDEFAHQNNDKELLAAVQDAMVGELGQIIIGSTPCGRNNYFFELVNKPTGFKVFRLPVFEESKFDITKPIKSQNLIPIAPWIDIDKLETKRQRDAEIFRQEHVCSFLDDSLSFIPYNLIMRCIDKKLANYRYIIEKRPDFVYETENPMYMGIDVARNNDLTAIVIFEKVYVPETEKICFLERYIEVIQNMPLPQQKEKIDKLLNIFPSIVKVRVDSTGLGTGLSDFLIQKHGRGKIEGINFSSRVPTATLHQTIPIVEKMAVNLKNLMQDDMVYFIEDDLQIHHLNDIDYDYKALRRPGLGHGDLFFACCLALLPENYRHPASGELYTNIKPQIQKQPWEESINEKIKRLENEKRKRMEGIPWKI